MSLIDVKDLGVQFQTSDGLVYAVNGINFALDRGRKAGRKFELFTNPIEAATHRTALNIETTTN